jgi:hypothetical protein
MSTSPVAPVAATAVPVAPAAPKTALETIAAEIEGFLKQREQAVANVHAVEGAIQAAKYLYAKLQAEAVKAEAVVSEVVAEVEKL